MWMRQKSDSTRKEMLKTKKQQQQKVATVTGRHFFVPLLKISYGTTSKKNNQKPSF